ncbi:hypothetical protein LdCL_290029100 [Leishmania donovani]|uniref:Membrane-associated protein n=1 Tax=Leishmania donovani TaxID=5661 RepID=A0A3S7X2S5_LEIDO|nr:hypothetical protein LdCL_290029100 [Leishmania donovani]
MPRHSTSLHHSAIMTVMAVALLSMASTARGLGADSATPLLCDNDATLYTTGPDGTALGILLYEGVVPCASNETIFITIAKDPSPPNAVVALSEWSFLVSINNRAPATFTLYAMCGNTIKCQSTLTYALSQTMASSSSSDVLPLSSPSSSSADSVLPNTTYPLCSHASKARSYSVGEVYHDNFPMDIQDGSCVYTTSITGESTVGTVVVATSGLSYTFSSSKTAAVGYHILLGYIVRCNGITVCADTVDVLLESASVTTAPPTSTPAPTPAPPETLPWCSHRTYANTYRIGEVYFGDLLLDVKDTECRYTATIEDPSVGTAVVAEPSDPLGYVYSTSDDTVPQNTSIPYTIACNGVSICHGLVVIHLTYDPPACPNSVVTYLLEPGGSVTGTISSGTVCSSGATPSPSILSPVPGFFLDASGDFFFYATDDEAEVVAMVLMKCNEEVLCQIKVMFLVAYPTTAPPTTSTTTTAAPIVMCPKLFRYEVPTGQSISDTIDPVTTSSCNFTTYLLVNSSSDIRGSLLLNLLGEFYYKAPKSQAVDYAAVDVYCAKAFVCRTQLVFVAYTPLPTTSTTMPPLPPCANVYYYQTSPGVAINASLNNMPGQDMCAHGRYFTLNTSPQAGSVNVSLIGDFVYLPPKYEGQFSFMFTMHCMNQQYCTGTAYLLVSNEWTLRPAPTDSPVKPDSNASITNEQITCHGTCNASAWKTYPNRKVWDITPGAGYARKDGRTVNDMKVTWRNKSLVVLVYSLIGNLGVRFPTFEPITTSQRAYMEPKDFAGSVAPGSPGFEMSCLANQGRTGMGEDVWKWFSLTLDSGTGGVGAYYNTGQSWYQKFGGKHVNCDIFTDPCRYAPLLTPANYTNTSLGRWTVDVDDCDATWTGVFEQSSMGKMVKYDGSPVWSFVGKLQLQGTLYSEAVQARSWLEPGQFDALYSSHNILINLHQFVAVSKTGMQDPLISVDAEFFTYLDDETQDQAFGINMLVYPFVDSYMTTSYARDRHVKGFKWILQDWISPSDEHCPTCTGSKMKCVAPLQGVDVSYTGPSFPEGDCADGEGRVHLFKGPATMPSDCPDSKMHVFNQTGFSPTRNCNTAYQNMTLRGIVPGSSGLNETLSRAFHYEGTVQLVLLMDDHSYKRLDLHLSMYVSRLSKDSPRMRGGLSTCRSGSYWPVLDPLGSSLASSPFPLSVAAVTPLCIDDLSSSYGPNDWALFAVNMPGVKPSEVTVRSVYVQHNNSRIYLIYKDPRSGAASIPNSDADGDWWQYKYPFLAFRDLEAHVKNNSITYSTLMESSAAAADVVYAFTFIPGALGVDTDIEVVVEALIQPSAAAESTTEFRRVLHIDPLLTQLSRQGPPPPYSSSKRQQNRTNFYAMGATAGVAVALVVTVIFFMLADNSRPLPKWVPRGKLIKETVLSVLPAGLRGKKKPKRTVHKDMYDAMSSGAY